MDLNQYIGKTKDVLTIVSFDETELQKTNQKEIIANCKCSRCGEIVKVHLDRIVGKYKLYQNACKNCKCEFNIEQAKSKVIGNTYGVLTVISFEYKKETDYFLSVNVIDVVNLRQLDMIDLLIKTIIHKVVNIVIIRYLVKNHRKDV